MPMAETGVNFPLRNGRRSSGAIGKAICAEAVRALDPATLAQR